jgi:Bacterial protein of unknown function (DUF937)
MLEQLMGLIQDHSQEAVVNNPAVPNEHNDGVMQTIMGSIMGGMSQQAQGGQGGLGSLIGLLGGQSSGMGGGSGLMSNPMVAGIAQNAISGIMEKFGIHNAAAQGIVASVLPSVLGSLISKTNDPQDHSFNMSSIMGALGDGKLDMSDVANIAGSVLGGNQSQGVLGSLLGSFLGGGK